jgi:hypothetical protein
MGYGDLRLRATRRSARLDRSKPSRAWCYRLRDDYEHRIKLRCTCAEDKQGRRGKSAAEVRERTLAMLRIRRLLRLLVVGPLTLVLRVSLVLAAA